MKVDVWCYKCHEYIPHAHPFSNAFECSNCGYEIRVFIREEEKKDGKEKI